MKSSSYIKIILVLVTIDDSLQVSMFDTSSSGRSKYRALLKLSTSKLTHTHKQNENVEYQSFKPYWIGYERLG